MAEPVNSEINYYSPSSGVTLIRDPAPAFNPATSSKWKPGSAGPFERVLAGSGRQHGWFLYCVNKFLVLELWHSGSWVQTRWLDCTELLSVTGATQHLIAFGYDLDNSYLSLGVTSQDVLGRVTSSVHQTWRVPGLSSLFAHPAEIMLGSMPVTLAAGTDGSPRETWRSCGAAVFPVAGRFSSPDFLTRGELARQTGELGKDLGLYG